MASRKRAFRPGIWKCHFVGRDPALASFDQTPARSMTRTWFFFWCLFFLHIVVSPGTTKADDLIQSPFLWWHHPPAVHGRISTFTAQLSTRLAPSMNCGWTMRSATRHKFFGWCLVSLHGFSGAAPLQSQAQLLQAMMIEVARGLSSGNAWCISSFSNHQTPSLWILYLPTALIGQTNRRNHTPQFPPCRMWAQRLTSTLVLWSLGI